MKQCYFTTSVRAIADLIETDGILRGKPVWQISRINVPEDHRRQGHGTALLKRILADADAEGVVLELSPLPSDFTFSRTDLISWYKRHGFEGEHFMVRFPSPQGEAQALGPVDDWHG
jgi:GNAT superfamily N-acetyltransferase